MIKEKKKPYINNNKLYGVMCHYVSERNQALKDGKEPPRIPNYVGECFLLICNKLSTKGNFISYSYRDEMISDAIENCFHGNTKILTIEYGPIALDQIVGKQVTVKSKDGKWRQAEIRCFGKQKLFKYKFANRNSNLNHFHNEVVATADHRWLLNNGAETTNLSINDTLKASYFEEINDADGLLHGVIYGDGTGHKTTVYGDPLVVKQGNRYSFIRVCKQDKAREDIMTILENAGYVPQYRSHAHGDPIYWIGRFPLCKDLPFTVDPEYIAGFIHGWWLADGLKTKCNRKEITTSNKEAAYWLLDYASYAGYVVTGFREAKRIPGDGSFANGKSLYSITLASNFEPVLRNIEEYGDDLVYCVIEPETHSFTLANGILTGNCVTAVDSFDPDKSKNPFAYFTQIAWFAFIRRITKEKKQNYIKHRNFRNNEFVNELNQEGYSIQGIDNEFSDEVIKNFEEKIEKTNKSKKRK